MPTKTLDSEAKQEMAFQYWEIAGRISIVGMPLLRGMKLYRANKFIEFQNAQREIDG